MNLLTMSSELQYSRVSVDSPPLVRGFASTSVRDRSKDIVPSNEFDLAQFMATSGQLLLDHNFIQTPEGNKVAAGNVVLAVSAYIAEENPSNSEEWVVKAVNTDEFVSVWPKKLSPNMEIGTDGVFVVAEVTNPFAAELVLSGKLSAFSWRGFAQDQECDDKGCVLKAIDLVEISLVHLPDNPTSTFLLTDPDDPEVNFEVTMKDCEAIGMKFSKDQYTVETIKEYTKSLNIDKCTISDQDNWLYVVFGEDLGNAANAFEICKGNRRIIAAPKIKKRSEEVSRVTDLSKLNFLEEIDVPNDQKSEVEKTAPVKLILADINDMKSIPGFKLYEEVQKTAVISGQEVEIYGATYDVPAEVVKESAVAEAPVEEAAAEAKEEVKEEAEVEPVAEAPADEKTEQTFEMILSVLEGMKKDQKQTSDKLEALNSKIEEKDEAVQETLKNFQKKEEATKHQNKLSRLENMLSAFSEETPTEAAPKEVAKSEGSNVSSQVAQTDPIQSFFKLS